MNEEQQTAAPSAQDFFDICAQMLAASAAMQDTVERQAEEIRYLVAELKARR